MDRIIGIQGFDFFFPVLEIESVFMIDRYVLGFEIHLNRGDAGNIVAHVHDEFGATFAVYAGDRYDCLHKSGKRKMIGSAFGETDDFEDFGDESVFVFLRIQFLRRTRMQM